MCSSSTCCITPCYQDQLIQTAWRQNKQASNPYHSVAQNWQTHGHLVHCACGPRKQPRTHVFPPAAAPLRTAHMLCASSHRPGQNTRPAKALGQPLQLPPLPSLQTSLLLTQCENLTAKGGLGTFFASARQTKSQTVMDTCNSHTPHSSSIEIKPMAGCMCLLSLMAAMAVLSAKPWQTALAPPRGYNSTILPRHGAQVVTSSRHGCV